MLGAVGLASAMTPKLGVIGQESKISLEAMIPSQFGEWRQENAVTSLVVSPDVKARIDRVYNQTLARNYVNDNGERIMLSVAYGDDQSTRPVHPPEVCYEVQGFRVGDMTKGTIDLGGKKLAVMKFIATQGKRVEPITYWVMVGEIQTQGNFQRRVARFKYGLTGKIPSGILIRVSTISANESQSYLIEERFVRDMLDAVPTEYRKALVGTDS